MARYFVLAVIVLACATVGFGQKSKKKVKPVEPSPIIKNLYADQKADKGPFFQLKDRKIVDKYFRKDFAHLIWKWTDDAKNEMPDIGMNPLYGIADPEGITDFVIMDTGWGGDAKFGPETQAVVQVAFKKDGKEYMVSYRFEQQKNKQWKIYDIRYIDWSGKGPDKFLFELLSGKKSEPVM